LKSEDEKRAGFLLSISVVLVFTVIAFGSIAFYLFKEEIIGIVFSREYIVVALAVFILLANSALSFCAAIMGFSLVALGHNAAPLKINLFVTTASFVASYFVIPYFGYMGVIYVAFASAILGFAINYLYLRHVKFPVQINSAAWLAISLFVSIVILAIFDLTSYIPFVVSIFLVISVYSIYKSGIYQMLKGSFQRC